MPFLIWAREGRMISNAHCLNTVLVILSPLLPLHEINTSQHHLLHKARVFRTVRQKPQKELVVRMTKPAVLIFPAILTGSSLSLLSLDEPFSDQRDWATSTLPKLTNLNRAGSGKGGRNRGWRGFRFRLFKTVPLDSSWKGKKLSHGIVLGTAAQEAAEKIRCWGLSSWSTSGFVFFAWFVCFFYSPLCLDLLTMQLHGLSLR